MNLRTLDLNLLVILDVLLDEAHVSRAAEILCLSQPATSAALQRCRHLFNDELLERGRGIMRITAKAESLRVPIKVILGDITGLIDLPEIPLFEVQQTIRITMADYTARIALNKIYLSLEENAPKIDLIVQPWHGASSARAALIDGVTDIAVSIFSGEDENIHCEELFSERYVIALRVEHPAILHFDIDSWLEYPHILVSGRGENRSPLDIELERIGRRRRVGLVVPNFEMAISTIKNTNMIAMLPSRIIIKEEGIVAFPTPISIRGFSLSVAWHRRREYDRALRYVASLLPAILR